MIQRLKCFFGFHSWYPVWGSVIFACQYCGKRKDNSHANDL